MCNKKEVTSLPPKLTVTSFNLLGTNRLPIAPPISIVSIAQSREKVNIESSRILALSGSPLPSERHLCKSAGFRICLCSREAAALGLRWNLSTRILRFFVHILRRNAKSVAIPRLVCYHVHGASVIFRAKSRQGCSFADPIILSSHAPKFSGSQISKKRLLTNELMRGIITS